MTDFYSFAGEHPILTIILSLIATNIILAPFRMVYRHLNIRKAGWPSEHIDAGGNLKRKTTK